MGEFNMPCPHGNSIVTCIPCINDYIDQEAILAEIEENNY